MSSAKLDTRRYLIATVAGRVYTIPQSWVMGYCARRTGTTTQDAVSAWVGQQLAEESCAQRD